MLPAIVTEKHAPTQEGQKDTPNAPFTLTAHAPAFEPQVLTGDDSNDVSDLIDSLRMDGYDLFTLAVCDNLATFRYRGIRLHDLSVRGLE